MVRVGRAARHPGSARCDRDYVGTAGIGHWGGFGDFAPRLHWYAEVDGVARLGEYETLSIHVNVGFAFATRAFWR